MDYLLKMAEEINKQSASIPPQECGGYTSVYSLNGSPILPPLVSNESVVVFLFHSSFLFLSADDTRTSSGDANASQSCHGAGRKIQGEESAVRRNEGILYESD